jgi:hypothetical protein
LGSNLKEKNMSTISAGTTVGTALVNSGDTTGNLVIKTGANATTALTISGTDQSITVAGGLNLGAPVAVASGGTGANSASAARTNLSAAQSGANSDITSLSGLTTALSVAQGGTGLNAVGTSGNVLTSNGTTWTSSAPAGGPNPLHGDQVFTSSGTFNVPAGVTAVKVTVIAAGGNGGSGVTDNVAGGSGGAGGYVVDVVSVTAGGTATVTVGTNSGTRTSSFAGATTITASGGNNGSNGTPGIPGAVGLSGAATIFGVTYYESGLAKNYSGISNINALVVTSGTVREAMGQVYSHGFGISGNENSSNVSGRANGLGYGASGGGGGTESGYTAGGTGTNGLVIVEW